MPYDANGDRVNQFLFESVVGSFTNSAIDDFQTLRSFSL
jgi:hypothetical protein